MLPVVTRVRCFHCGHPTVILPGDLALCAPCVWDLASEANRAYDEVRARPDSPHPKKATAHLVTMVRLYLDHGHLNHIVRYSACPFCIVEAP